MSIEALSAASSRPSVESTGGTLLERAACLCAMVTGFSIPLSTSFSEIATGLFMAAWFCSGRFVTKWAAIRRNSVALLSLALFALLALGMTWSGEDWTSSARCLLKYRELVYLPMFIVVFQEARLRRLATLAFMAGAAVLLGMSYFEWLSGADYGISSFEDYIIGKDRIMHSIIMALLAYLAGLEIVARGLDSAPGRWRWVWRAACATVVVLAAGNVIFMLHGRTGYLSLAALGVLFLFQRMGARGIVIACLALSATAWGAFSLSTSIRGRVDQTLLQLRSHFGAERKHAPDPRLEFYENTVRLIARHPLMGTGTGSFRTQYSKLIEQTDDQPTADPHNEFLNLASQVGIPGAVLYAALLAVQWFATARLPAPDRQIGRSVVLITALGSLFNSMILSVTGGLIFAYLSGIAFAGLSRRPEAAAGAGADSAEFATASVADRSSDADDRQRRRAA